jgi:Ca-activated chloride channel homolog
MKLILFILIAFAANNAISQNWRDTLDMARKAYKKGDYSKALDYYEKIQKTKPESVDLSDEMGQSAYKAREFERAEKIYQQGSSGKKTGTDRAKNYHNIGNSRLKSKNYDGAIEAYKEALKNNPKSEKTRYNLSEAIRKKEEKKKKDQQNQDQNDPQNQNQQQNQQQNQNNQQQQQKNQNQNQQKNQNQSGNDKKQDDSKSRLPNNAAEKMLDDLMKKEAETKRRMSGGSSGKSEPKSGKDW